MVRLSGEGLIRMFGQVVRDQVKVFAWYDNEWGFSNRLVELSHRISA
jgi:glyceraldehyde-3-phosphate dehydrogenase/erythrose-4-phosphate dehydrogenase